MVICTINPLLSNYQETTNTLKFGISAGAVKNQVRVNEKLSEKKSTLMQEQLKELNDYKTEMSKNKEIFENKVATQATKIEELDKKNLDLLDENNKLKCDVNMYEVIPNLDDIIYENLINQNVEYENENTIVIFILYIFENYFETKLYVPLQLKIFT